MPEFNDNDNYNKKNNNKYMITYNFKHNQFNLHSESN